MLSAEDKIATSKELRNKENKHNFKLKIFAYQDIGVIDLFDVILYVPSTIFQLCRDGSSWVEPVLS